MRMAARCRDGPPSCSHRIDPLGLSPTRSNMATVSSQSGQNQGNGEHRAGVIKSAQRYAGGSAAGIAGIVTASAFGAVPMPVAMVAIIAFGMIMMGALIVAGIYILRRR